MKKDKVVFISSSDLVAEVNLIKYLTVYHLEDKQNAVKIFSYYETLKQLLNDPLKNYTGLSLFSSDSVENNLTTPLLEEFKLLLRKIDPNWWTDSFDRYLEQGKQYLPDAVKFIITDINHEESICSELAMNTPLIRIDSKKLPTDNHRLNLNNFEAIITKQNVFYLQNPHSSILLEKEDLNKNTLKKVSSIMEEINND